MSLSPSVIAAAQASQRKWKVPASVVLAQYANESAWGTKIPPGSHNYFGIKARPGQPYVTAMTSEYINGQWVRIPQNFAKYANDEEGFDAHGRFLGLTPRYAAAFKTKSPEDFARAIAKAGYATAPGYANAIIKIMRDYKLEQYDVLPPAAPITVPKEVPAPVANSLLWLLNNVFSGSVSTLAGTLSLIYAFFSYHHIPISNLPLATDWKPWVLLGLSLVFGMGGASVPQPEASAPVALPSSPKENDPMDPVLIGKFIDVFATLVPVLEKILTDLPTIHSDLAALKAAVGTPAAASPDLVSQIDGLLARLNALAPSVTK